MATDGKSLSVRAGWWAAPILTALAAGCVTTENSVEDNEKPPAPGLPCQVVATWQNCIAYAADPTRGGVQAPGLAGRLYLFGPTIKYPMTGEGSVLIEMFDESQGTPVKREQWEIDPKTLRALAATRHDRLGLHAVLAVGRVQTRDEQAPSADVLQADEGRSAVQRERRDAGAGQRRPPHREQDPAAHRAASGGTVIRCKGRARFRETRVFL